MAQTKVFGITIGKKSTAPKPSSAPKEAPVLAEFVPSLPTVNALPLKIRESYKEKDLIKKFVAGAIALAVLFAGTYGYSLYAQAQHKAAIDQLSVTSTTLNKSIAVLQPYDNYKVNVGGKITTLSTYLSKDVDAAKIVKILFNAADQNGISFTNVSLTITGDDGKSTCPSTDPFNSTPTIGCITITGIQPNSDAVNNFFNQIGSTQGFVNIFVAGSTYGSGAGTSTNNFSGSVAFTSALYSNKYSNYSLPIDILLKNGLNGSPAGGATTGTGTGTSTPAPTTPGSRATPSPSATPTATPKATPSGTATGTPSPNPTSTQGNG